MQEIGCGLVIPPARPDLVAEAIRSLVRGDHDLEEMGRKGRAYVERTEASRARSPDTGSCCSMSARNSVRTAGRELAGPALLVVIVVAQVLLQGRLLHNGANFDEGVYLAAVDALRHGQQLGTDVFAAQFPGFYDLLRVAAVAAGTSIRASGPC